MHKLCVIEHTEDYELSFDESGSVHSNRYATAIVTFTLPSISGNPIISKGAYFYFASQVYSLIGRIILIQPKAGDIINDNSVPITGEYIWADGGGEGITLVSDGVNAWNTIDKSGVWKSASTP